MPGQLVVDWYYLPAGARLPEHSKKPKAELVGSVRFTADVLVESAHTAVRSPGPLRAFYQRVRARRGHPIAIVATARKMAKLFWHLLLNEQDHAYTHSQPRWRRRSAPSSSKPGTSASDPQDAPPLTASNAESSNGNSHTRPSSPTNA